MLVKKVETKSWSWMTLSLIMAGADLVFMGSATVGTGVVSAYNDDLDSDLPCKWWHTANTVLHPKYEHHPLYPAGGQYLTAFNAAIYDWDTSDTPVDVQYDTSQHGHQIGVESMGSSGPYGYTSWRCLYFGKRSSTYARINPQQVPEDSSTQSILELKG